MSALAPLDADARQRLLALIGIDVYLQRAPREQRTAIAEPASTRASAAAATSAAPAANGLLQFECDLADAGAQPLTGPYAALLRQVLQAMGVAPREVRFVQLAGPDGAAGMRLAQGSNRLLAPALAEVRNSAAAKRTLWTALRTLRREQDRR